MSQVELALDAQAALGECPRWNADDQKLYWIDINKFQLHRFDPDTASDEFLQFEEEIGCFAFREQGGFLLAMRSGYYLLDGWNTELTFISDPEADLEQTRFNDGRCDAKGRLFAGSYYPPKDYDGANLWSLDANKQVELIADDLLTTNGIAWSPDNSVFYYSDTPKHIIYACDYELDTGKVGERRTFCEFPHGKGRPDGASVDVEGYYWAALYEGGRIVRISPDGEIVQEIAVPARCPTMVAFGGEDMKTLYITSAGGRPDEELKDFPHPGGIFKLRVDVAGIKENKFPA
ncbi:SMP-30/gluconolactonase/LRE family protein [Agaribacterium haliotis]|uniref:SMP-30/gluconolactonase/LRE family protein n=1 Tax=Agaribacterium haliotis TaxID=2013869 RepID=UPI000BB592F2|nr:SMP-30/gluconolactonase/LRE family protein [Agaribacterium haliotis]